MLLFSNLPGGRGGGVGKPPFPPPVPDKTGSYRLRFPEFCYRLISSYSIVARDATDLQKKVPSSRVVADAKKNNISKCEIHTIAYVEENKMPFLYP